MRTLAVTLAKQSIRADWNVISAVISAVITIVILNDDVNRGGKRREDDGKRQQRGVTEATFFIVRAERDSGCARTGHHAQRSP